MRRTVDAARVEAEPVLVRQIARQVVRHAGSAAKRSMMAQMCLMPETKSST